MVWPALAAIVALASPAQEPKTIYDFSMESIEGKSVPLSRFKGKVLLVVNVASRCGNTPQYKGLQALYESKKKTGLEILGFPANDFRGQEPGTNAEIKEFCTANYGVTFPMFSKIAVTGDAIHPLYAWLVAKSERHEAVEWNFAKFLIGKDGRVLKRFTPKTQPDSPEVLAAIESALEG